MAGRASGAVLYPPARPFILTGTPDSPGRTSHFNFYIRRLLTESILRLFDIVAALAKQSLEDPSDVFVQ